MEKGNEDLAKNRSKESTLRKLLHRKCLENEKSNCPFLLCASVPDSASAPSNWSTREKVKKAKKKERKSVEGRKEWKKTTPGESQLIQEEREKVKREKGRVKREGKNGSEERL